MRHLAPRFELYDQHSQLVKFERYLGRTELLVVFIDGQRSVDEDPLLKRLQDEHARLAEAGLQVVAISLATPHAIRRAEQRMGMEFWFPVLTDIDMQSPIPAPVHRLWGLADDNSPEIQTGAYFVDRRGMVAYDGVFPEPIDDVMTWLDEITASVNDGG